MPVPELAVAWEPADVALTAAGATALSEYDRRRHDSALYCMPLGTPRNMLSSAPAPIEILQRPEQITIIFDGRGDVRRIYLDKRPHPADPIANWMGHSIGTWDGESLRIDTVAMTSESRLNESGLPHSDAMRLTEVWRLVDRNDETLLSVSIQIDDRVNYESALMTTRFFRRSPHTVPAETAANCQLDQWRDYLERHSKELSMQLRDRPQTGTAQ